MNTNVPTTGMSNSLNRSTANIDLGYSGVEKASSDGVKDSQQISKLTRTTDLKKAELRGEHVAISDEQLIKAIDRAIKAMEGKSTNLEFSVHKQTNIISVKVLDSTSGEIIREIPPEKTLDFVAKLWEMAGILIDEKG
ncbi:flagellar protein FlaG [Paenibacillus sp. LHD-38]|uniref:flagellar protein FlaG n=1 Tax=Paenibacillus sp. LHD-38 TaxID=3072143 RepID=UPI00280CE7B4|nr:flagellar protein FlaG [Paenibacillus sp. LHD-38]MDQ8734016.1 flagellar protein FlaG [Paenibacillus sp. LHD-38]